MGKEKLDGYKVLTYLRGEKTAELTCHDRSEAQELLSLLTLSRNSRAVIVTGSQSNPGRRPIICDKAELWRDGELIAFGLRPDPLSF